MLLNQRFVRLAAIIAVACSTILFSSSDAAAQTADELLQQGVTEYNQGDINEAYHTLRRVDAIQLATDDDRALLNETLTLVRAELAIGTKLQLAIEAENTDQLSQAMDFYKQIAEDDSAPREIRQQALAGLARVERRRMEGASATQTESPVVTVASTDDNQVIEYETTETPANTEPAEYDTANSADTEVIEYDNTSNTTASDESLSLDQARVTYARKIVEEADAAAAAGRTNQAIARYRYALQVDPTNTDAAQALAALSANPTPTQAAGVLDQTVINIELERQLATARYDQALREADKQLAAGNYKAANSAAILAKTILDTKRQFLPEADYLAMRQTALDRAAVIAQAEEVARVEQIQADQTAQALRAQAERQEAEQAKATRIRELLNRARDLSREQNYELALEQLDQALFIDPNNGAAQFMSELINDQIAHEKFRKMREYRRTQMMGNRLTNFEQTIPINDLVTYPPDWAEITDLRIGAGSTVSDPYAEANRVAKEKLSQVIDTIDVQGQQLGNILTYLNSLTGVNHIAKWGALENVDVRRDTTVNIQPLTNITAERALELILDEAGGAFTELSFTYEQGDVIISTSDELSLDTSLRTYDIRDIIINTSLRTRPPEFDLGNVTSDSGDGASQGSIFEDSNDDDDATPARAERVQQILDIIRTIDPNSWIENGGLTSSVNELNGMLFVTTTPENHEEIGLLFRRIRDQRALQIAVDSRFLFVTDNFFEQVGVDIDFTIDTSEEWFTGPIVSSNDTAAVADGLTTGTVVPGTIPPVSIPSFILGGPAGAPLGFILDDLRVSVLIAATQSDTRNITVNTPRVLVFNGEGANIAISRNVAYVRNLTPIVATNSVAFNPQVAFARDGVVLNIRQAVVSADRRYVTINLRPQLNQLVSLTNFAVFGQAGTGTGGQQAGVDDDGDGQVDEDPDNGTDDDGDGAIDEDGADASFFASGIIQRPETQTTTVDTTASIPDRGTLLIGGQRLVGESEVEVGVPVLSKLPFLNRMFTNRTLTRDERTLLILVKPTIIIQSEIEEQRFPGLNQSPGLYNLGNNR